MMTMKAMTTTVHGWASEAHCRWSTWPPLEKREQNISSVLLFNMCFVASVIACPQNDKTRRSIRTNHGRNMREWKWTSKVGVSKCRWCGQRAANNQIYHLYTSSHSLMRKRDIANVSTSNSERRPSPYPPAPSSLGSDPQSSFLSLVMYTYLILKIGQKESKRQKRENSKGTVTNQVR